VGLFVFLRNLGSASQKVDFSLMIEGDDEPSNYLSLTLCRYHHRSHARNG
jgi:hypothetical protein